MRKILAALIILVISTSLITSCSDQNYKKESSKSPLVSSSSKIVSFQVQSSSKVETASVISKVLSSSNNIKPESQTSSTVTIDGKELLVRLDLPVPNLWQNNFNAKRAGEIIDGYILKPGEIFSFNTVVGERTVAKGFIKGLEPTWINGKWVNLKVQGSGVCRKSTDVFQGARLLGLEIIDHKAHTFKVAYAKDEDCAAVNWANGPGTQGWKDLIFRNNKDFSIQIKCDAFEAADGKSYILRVDYYKINN